MTKLGAIYAESSPTRTAKFVSRWEYFRSAFSVLDGETRCVVDAYTTSFMHIVNRAEMRNLFTPLCGQSRSFSGVFFKAVTLDRGYFWFAAWSEVGE